MLDSETQKGGSEWEETLYVSDLDGTLLNRQSAVSGTSVKMLNEMIRRGLRFTVATARTPATVEPLLSAIETEIPYIVMAGAAIWSHRKQEYVYTNPLKGAEVERICGVYASRGLRPFVYRRHGNKLGVHHYGPMSRQEEAFVEERRHLALKEFYLDDTNYEENQDEALLVLSINDYDRLEIIYEEMKENEECSSVFYRDIFDRGTGILETYASGTSKAEAVRRLSREIGARRVVVFGDNLNDMPMLEVADYSVAPSNAVEEVRAVVDEVIGSNDEDAVVRWIAADYARNGGTI